MNAETLAKEQEDEIKLLLLSDSEEERIQAVNRLFAIYGETMMRSIEYHHPGLNGHDQKEVLLLSIQRFADIVLHDVSRIDRPLKPQLLRTAILVGKELYRKVSRRRERESGELLDAVAQSLKDSELGHTWHQVADSSFRKQISDRIRGAAASMKPRQRQIAMMFAETWGLELSEQEAITEIYRTTGERLTRDSFKRAFAEVRQKLREPMLKTLIEEGICPQSLMQEK